MSEQQLLDTMRQYWGYNSFRPLQREAMECLLEKRDGIVVFPTGGGKSLCFQVPAVVAGRAVVISPLISLMQDQVSALTACGVKAAFINSTVPGAQVAEVARLWREGLIQLLYVAPERALSASFRSLLRAAPPAFFAIDEAHCISQWGHDFRPEYRQLVTLRQDAQGAAIHAYTATATAKVRDDIAAQLQLQNPEMFVGDFDRPNLHYRIERRKRATDQVAEIMRAHEGKSGIIYCISRKDTERMAAGLRERGFNVMAYHAGLEDKQRKLAQRAFTSEAVDAIVATVAFGMGIDRSNVRFVIHAAMPKSIEHYQQETGRAGRDGLPAECVLLYSSADTMKWMDILTSDDTMPEAIRDAHVAKLTEMDAFAAQHVCRHRFLVEYFGQPWTKGPCGNCDVCAGGEADSHPDGTRIAQMILSCVARLGQRRGAAYTTYVLRADTLHEVQPQHTELSTYGLLKQEPEQAIRRWIDECVGQGLLERDAGQFKTLKITPAGWALLRSEREARLSMFKLEIDDRTGARQRAQQRRAERRERAEMKLGEQERGLFEALRAKRLQLARAIDCPPYMVFHDSVLASLANLRPTSVDALYGIPGMGPVRIEKYGDVVTELISHYALQHGLDTDVFDQDNIHTR
jgi:ATP-dependent DNA helicase RecQ